MQPGQRAIKANECCCCYNNSSIKRKCYNRACSTAIYLLHKVFSNFLNNLNVYYAILNENEYFSFKRQLAILFFPINESRDKQYLRALKRNIVAKFDSPSYYNPRDLGVHTHRQTVKALKSALLTLMNIYIYNFFCLSHAFSFSDNTLSDYEYWVS